MNTIIYLKLDNENFNENSLDSFVRHQEVKECWRNINGEWQLMPIEFVENWNGEQLIAKAAVITEKIKGEWYGYGAFVEDKVVGYITVSYDKFGSRNQYSELVLFHVSEPYRNMGIGKSLFHMACKEAKKNCIERLYISAHSSKESQAAYRKLGCTFAEEINHRLAEEEPCDIQLEFVI